jgi:DNA-binding transcriptional LysR family regulator
MAAMHRRNVFDTEALRLFVAVADAGSFTGAADALDYTQSAVSRRIASLEGQAGGRLFDRLPRGVRLTPAGHALHGHAVGVLERLARAERELAAIHAGRGGTLRTGAFSTANISLVPAALRAFAAARPDVEVIAAEGRSHSSIRRLADGALDLAVVSDYPSGLPTAEGVTTTPLCEDELLVALHRDHPSAGRDPVDLCELRDESWIQDAPPDGHTTLTQVCARAGFTPRRTVRIAEWTGKFGHVAAGLGVALVPSLASWAVPAELVLRGLGDLAPRRTVHVALPDHPLPAALLLRDLLRETARHDGLADGAPRL